MKALPMPRALQPLAARLAHRARADAAVDEVPDTRMPDDADVLMLQRLAGTQMGRIAAEIALEEGGRRDYAPRREAQVLGAGQRR